MEAPWVERMWRGALTVKNARAERAKFKKFPPPTEQEARELIQRHLEMFGVIRGPSMDERREAWGMR